MAISFAKENSLDTLELVQPNELMKLGLMISYFYCKITYTGCL